MVGALAKPVENGKTSGAVCDRSCVEHLKPIVMALTQGVGEIQMAAIAAREIHRALGADASCIHLKRPDGFYHLMGELGCTPEFCQQWRRVPQDTFRFVAGADEKTDIFIGTTSEFKSIMPVVGQLVEQAGRQIVGFAVMRVAEKISGVLGFSFNRPPRTLDRGFVQLLVNLCSQAIERARLTDLERKANRAKSDFLASVSHEIRTPMGLIQGYTDLLQNAPGMDKAQRKWAEIVHRNTLQLINVVGEVLDLSRIENEKLEIRETLVATDRLIEDIKQTTSLRAAEKGLRLTVEARGLPPHILTDEVRLRQIVLNLIGNAIKFTSRGQIEVELMMGSQTTKSPDAKTQNQMPVQPESSLQQLCVVVKDTGIGIAEEYHERVFDAYARVENYPVWQVTGTGLGLPISRAWARALGGDLVLMESTRGVGSTFRLTVAFRIPGWGEDGRTQRSSLAEPARERDKRPIEGLRLLLVEDLKDNQDLIRHNLSLLGGSVDVADSGQKAMKLVREHVYDAVLMDIQMPVMDGHETYAALRSQGYEGPILALTAYALKSERERALAEGFAAYFTKPADYHEFSEVLRRLV